jgi:iron complex outermembrane receptor protein
MSLKARPGSADLFTADSTEGSSPRHQVVVQSYLDLPGRLEFSQTFRYITALRTQEVGSYGTADARLAWRPVPHLELSVVGQNLLQPHHAEYAGNPGPLVGIKRGVYATMTWRR